MTSSRSLVNGTRRNRSPAITVPRPRNFHERINVSYLRIELKKAVAGHKTGRRINATRAEMEAAGLKPGDYTVIGTHPQPVKSDLPPVPQAESTEVQ